MTFRDPATEIMVYNCKVTFVNPKYTGVLGEIQTLAETQKH